MSAAGTPSTDPWVILARERARYEEQFKGLHPIHGIVTGDQAKGFLMQSQLPLPVLGQIWALSDTDSDGKMDINEFSIACKLINLKLRGFEIPKGLPPSLLASLKVHTPPAIPPLPNPALISGPIRPQPPKSSPMVTSPSQALLPNLMAQAPGIQAGVVPPMQAYAAPVGVGTHMGAAPPMNVVQPLHVVPPMGMSMAGGAAPLLPGLGSSGPPLVSAAPVSTVSVPHMSPIGVVPQVAAVIGAPSATSTPRASVGSLDRAMSIESP